MNIYLLTQDVNVDYDTYDAAIVCAESDNFDNFTVEVKAI